MTSLWRNFPSGNISAKNFYSVTQDGVIVNNEWWGAPVPVVLTIDKSSLVVDNIQLSVTLTTATPFTGTIGKGNITLAGKQQSVQLGRNLSVGKSSGTISNKALTILRGTNLSLNKSTSTVSNKTLGISLGFASAVGKNTLNISYKSENISVGTIAQLNKMVYNVGNKPLLLNLGFNSALNKSTVILNTKLESISAGAVALLNKNNIFISNKQLVLDVASEIPFIGNIGKSTLNTSPYVLSVHLGFNGTLLPQLISTTEYPLNAMGGFVGDVGLNNLFIINRQLHLINTKIIYPSEQIFNMAERSSYNIMKPRQTFYNLTDK